MFNILWKAKRKYKYFPSALLEDKDMKDPADVKKTRAEDIISVTS
jgi:uncharacterized protein YcaQ